SCAAPTPSFAAPPMTYAAPAEPGCAAPGAPTLAPNPTFAPPQGDPSASYSPAVPNGIVPEPTPDPASYYPTQSAAAPAISPRAETWTTVKPRQTKSGDDSSSVGGGLPSLASLWSK
ncbi:MAG: hypothetical protein M3552_21190, partial [Planctomycetota bacterium]|nr:hypothetical protein [Planctomycetota bacterium]